MIAQTTPQQHAPHVVSEAHELGDSLGGLAPGVGIALLQEWQDDLLEQAGLALDRNLVAADVASLDADFCEWES